MNILKTGLFLLLTTTAQAEIIKGVEFPMGAVSFADRVVEFSPDSTVSGIYLDAETALGVPDGKHPALGDEGTLILEFTDNSLTTSGNEDDDLWIFEVGAEIEPTQVYISHDGKEWIDVGATTGATYGIDIDAFVKNGVVRGRKYSFVKIVDLLPHQSGSPYTGADIDAVGAISSGAPSYYGSYIETKTVEDVNSNGQDEIAILKVHPKKGLPSVLVKDSVSGNKIKSINFLNKLFRPVSMVVLSDSDGNGFPNIGVLGIKNNGKCIIEIRDLDTKAIVNKIVCQSE